MADWTLNDGLDLIRAIQGECRQFGYHLTLGGSVLNRGKSSKDIDLYFLPLENDKEYGPAEPELLKEWLATVWGQPEAISPYEAEDAGIGGGLFAEGANIVGQQWAAIEGPNGQFQVVQMPLANPVQGGFGAPIHVAKKESAYKFKLKYFRPGGDRIDVFIIPPAQKLEPKPVAVDPAQQNVGVPI